MTRKQQDILTKAVLAVLLPALVVGGAMSGRIEASVQLLLTWPAGRWFVAILVAVAPILECYLLVRLYHVLRAGGRLVRAETLMLAEPAVASRRRWGRRFRFAAGGLLVALIMLEGAFRLLGIDPMPPSHRFRAAERSTVNRQGIREPWDELDPAGPTLRIAFLGDSITSGESVAPDKTFCHLVEGLVSPLCPGGVMTINMGDPGTSPSEQAERYEDLRWSIQPGVLVHVLHPDDLDGASTLRSLMQMHAIRDSDLWFGRFSHVLSYVERRVRYCAAMRDTLFSMRGGVSEGDRRESWAALRETVGQIKRMVESHQGRYVIVFHPWLFRLDDYPLVEEHRLMREFATQLGVPYLDLMEVYAGRDADALHSGEGSELPNAAAHTRVANRIARFLLDDVLDECDGG